MAKKSLYTRRLGTVVAKGAQSSTLGRYHVIAGEAKKWSVVSSGSVRPVKAFDSQEEAVSFAKETASKKTGEVIIHTKSGQVGGTISYAKK